MVKVELSLSAKKLKNVAGTFKGTSDPFAVVTKIATKHGDKPEVLGKTEVVKNNLSPQWAKLFVFDHDLGSNVKVAINIFDEVRKSDNKGIGCAVFELDELLSARGGTKSKKLKNSGTLTAVLRKSVGLGVFRFRLSGIKLKNTEGFLRKSDPFFELVRRDNAAGGATFNVVFRSEVVKDNLSPEWKNHAIELSNLCSGNLDSPFLIRIYDYESSGKHVLMGQFETTVNAMVNNVGKSPFTCQVKGKDTGEIAIVQASVSIPTGAGQSSPSVQQQMTNMSISPKPIPPARQPTFVDYVSGGCKLNVTVAIDFTGSNGDPRQPGTLHYLHTDGKLNDYEKAITAVLGAIERFDEDKQYPVLGFGAKYNGEVLHAFQCGKQTSVSGVQGVLQAYRDVFKSGLIMSKPTVFNDVMQYAANRADESLDAALQAGGQTYSILLLLTDGCVSDVQATADFLKELSNDPISIVMVGIGNANFDGMRFLDDIKQPGVRDVAQFVPFNQYSSNPAALSAETLREIPDQLVGFFQSRGIAPLERQAMKEEDIVVEDEEEIDLALNLDGDEIVVSRGGVDYSSW